MNSIINFDKALFVWINRDLSNAAFDLLMPLISRLADPAVMLLWMPVLAFVIYRTQADWRKGAECPEGRSMRSFFYTGLYIGLVYGANAGIYNLLKITVGRARPFVVQDAVVRISQSAIADMPRYTSFPSGHAVNAFMIAVLLSSVFKKGRAVFYSAAILVAFSRVYNGVHYPFDAACGAFLGILITLLIMRLRPVYNRPGTPWGRK